jgi:bla regulator protein BlaR1
MANHLWQSTLFALAMALLTLAFRRNRANIRYAIWLAASLKFLLPFSLLVAIGSHFERPSIITVSQPVALVIETASQPFTSIPSEPEPTRPVNPLLFLWAAGVAVILYRWSTRWIELRRAALTAPTLPIASPVPIKSCDTRLEPGVFGILRPVILIPNDMAAHLTPTELQAILQHELCHVRRRDNLAALLQMLVEALFWFHPLVWWLGARIVAERENACDEAVLQAGNQPEVYAEGILNVCRYYVESRLKCAPGVTGADLEKRIEAIMSHRIHSNLNIARKLLLTAAALACIATPLWLGLIDSPHLQAQQSLHDPPLKFEFITIKPARNPNTRIGFDMAAGGGLQLTSITLHDLVIFAYDLQSHQLSSGPAWTNSEAYDIVAKPDPPEGPADVTHLGPMQERMRWDRARNRTRTLLADRFHLTVHEETKEGQIYALIVAKGGPRLQASKSEGNPSTMRSPGAINARRGTTDMLAALLSNWLRLPIVNRTGLAGNYDYKLTYAQEPPVGAGGAMPPTLDSPPDSLADSGESVFAALQEQLGLKIASQKGPIQVFVIDRVEHPSAN